MTATDLSRSAVKCCICVLCQLLLCQMLFIRLNLMAIIPALHSKVPEHYSFYQQVSTGMSQSMEMFHIFLLLLGKAGSSTDPTSHLEFNKKFASIEVNHDACNLNLSKLLLQSRETDSSRARVRAPADGFLLKITPKLKPLSAQTSRENQWT